MLSPLDPRHTGVRNILRVVGPLILLIGVIFVIVGLGSFFAAFGSFGPPRYFWCAFVGMPLVVVGLTITSAGFMGAMARYSADESAPVAKDMFNYMADGTRDSVRNIAAAIGEGLRSGSTSATPEQIIRCHKCNTENKSSADFCKACGTPLRKTHSCPNCGELNDPDARFCDECGKPLAAQSD